VRHSHRPLPVWYDEAKFGIFVHWTAATVPAFAPVGPSPFEIAETDGWEASLARSPYVEWYLNSLSIAGSPVAEYHAEHFPGSSYDDFVAAFLGGHAGWRPEAWARLFAAAGARYVVLVTKHHDGVTLWPTATPNPFRAGWSAARDVVGDLSEAVRAAGLRFGTYYSGGLDWTFGGLPITDVGSMIRAVPQSDEYRDYADAHWRELIDRYRPSLLWNDIGYPASADLEALQTYYYERVPDGVVNDRFRWAAPEAEVHADFVTPEYSTTAPADGRKWESTRGVGSSVGYNRMEGPDDYLSACDLVRLVADVIARGGNLLLNVGPMVDGRIPWVQAERLLALGWWLDGNGEAIYGTRPWRTPGGELLDGATTGDGLGVVFTEAADGRGDRYAIVLGSPSRHLEVPLPTDVTSAVVVTRLGHDAPLRAQVAPGRIRIELTDQPPAAAAEPALVVRFRAPGEIPGPVP
jgi:alpha-L-fucosidase